LHDGLQCLRIGHELLHAGILHLLQKLWHHRRYLKIIPMRKLRKSPYRYLDFTGYPVSANPGTSTVRVLLQNNQTHYGIKKSSCTAGERECFFFLCSPDIFLNINLSYKKNYLKRHIEPWVRA
jgi:hypothetical protein